MSEYLKNHKEHENDREKKKNKSQASTACSELARFKNCVRKNERRNKKEWENNRSLGTEDEITGVHFFFVF